MNRVLALTLALASLSLHPPGTAAQEWIDVPGVRGDQLLAFYDARASRVPFLNVSNPAGERMVIRADFYNADLTIKLASQAIPLEAGGNVVIDPTIFEGGIVNGNAGVAVITPVRSETDLEPVVPPAPLMGNWTLANLDLASAFGENFLGRFAVRSDGQRASVWRAVDGGEVRYQRIDPAVLAVPAHFNPQDLGPVEFDGNRVVLVVFDERYDGGFGLVPRYERFQASFVDRFGVLVVERPVEVYGVLMSDLVSLAGAPLRSSGKVFFERHNGGGNAFGIFSQSLGTFAEGGRMVAADEVPHFFPPSPTPTGTPTPEPTRTTPPRPTPSPTRTPSPTATPTKTPGPSRTPQPTPVPCPGEGTTCYVEFLGSCFKGRKECEQPGQPVCKALQPPQQVSPGLCGIHSTPTPAPSRTPSPTATPTSTPAPTRTPTPTMAPTPTKTPRPTPSPTRTPTPVPCPGEGTTCYVEFLGSCFKGRKECEQPGQPVCRALQPPQQVSPGLCGISTPTPTPTPTKTPKPVTPTPSPTPTPTSMCPDNDHDGYTAQSCGGTDCNDSDGNINPGEQELCDNINNNCRGGVDEAPVVGVGDTCYRELGGVCKRGEKRCQQAGGGGGNSLQCFVQPSSPTVSPDLCGISTPTPTPSPTRTPSPTATPTSTPAPTRTPTPTMAPTPTPSPTRTPSPTATPTPVCPDSDNDGYTAQSCGGTDCNDSDGNINPGERELCDNINQNCNAAVDEAPVVGVGDVCWRKVGTKCWRGEKRCQQAAGGGGNSLQCLPLVEETDTSKCN